MRTLGTTIEVNRGEVFTLSREIVDVSGVPYILPKLTNPYLMITITSGVYSQDGMYEKNYWLSLASYMFFDDVTPVYQPDVTGDFPPLEKNRVYYTMDGEGNKTYYYYDETTQKYIPYSFVFTKLFLNNDTREWIEGIYRYQFKIASGQLSIDWLTNIYKSVYKTIVNIPTDKHTLAKQICKVRPDLLRNVDWEAPIVNYWTKDILRQPHKLVVRNNA